MFERLDEKKKQAGEIQLHYELMIQLILNLLKWHELCGTQWGFFFARNQLKMEYIAQRTDGIAKLVVQRP